MIGKMTQREPTLPELRTLLEHVDRQRLEPEDWALLKLVLEIAEQSGDAEVDEDSDPTFAPVRRR